MPEGGEARTGRRRLRAEWRAETTWRRHEISGRLKDLANEMSPERVKAMLDKVDKVLNEARLPVTVTKQLTASTTIERTGLPTRHTLSHGEGAGTCTCGKGPWCACGYCQACGMIDRGFLPIPPKEESG